MTNLQIAELNRIESELLTEREALRTKFSPELLATIEAKGERLAALKRESDYEQRLNVKWREKFPEITDETFSTLWKSRLKEEAMIRDADDRKNGVSDAVKQSESHPVYRSGLNDTHL